MPARKPFGPTLFILTERWIEGDRNARVKLHHADWSLRKMRLRLFKWAVWLGIGPSDGWGLGVLLYRCSESSARLDGVFGPSYRLWHHRGFDPDNLRIWRFHARTNLHLRLPVAKDTGGYGRSRHAHGWLSRLAR